MKTVRELEHIGGLFILGVAVFFFMLLAACMTGETAWQKSQLTIKPLLQNWGQVRYAALDHIFLQGDPEITTTRITGSLKEDTAFVLQKESKCHNFIISISGRCKYVDGVLRVSNNKVGRVDLIRAEPPTLEATSPQYATVRTTGNRYDLSLQ